MGCAFTTREIKQNLKIAKRVSVLKLSMWDNDLDAATKIPIPEPSELGSTLSYACFHSQVECSLNNSPNLDKSPEGYHILSLHMGKPTICIGENKGADQLRGNREADQRLCFRYSDSTIPPLLNSNFVLLIVPSRYFCGGSFCFMSWCLKYFCAVGALCMFAYF